MIRKIFKFIPRSVQEWIKLLFYNLKISGFSFARTKKHYKTNGKNWTVLTKSPLYYIVKDVNRYEKFYTVSPGDVVIDAGANEGILSVIYSQKVKENGKIFSFEPDCQNVEAFKVTVSLNPTPSNIELIEKGIWFKNMELKFHEGGNVASSIYYEGENFITKNIQVVSIDEFVMDQNIQKLDFVKMDIEGAEIEAVRGAVNSLKTLNPNFAIASYHVINGKHTYKNLEKLFSEYNYPYYTVFFEDGEIITYAGPFVKNVQ